MTVLDHRKGVAYRSLRTDPSGSGCAARRVALSAARALVFPVAVVASVVRAVFDTSPVAFPARPRSWLSARSS